MVNVYRRILQKTFDRKIPFSVHWELTYRCNLSCVHCYATNRGLNNELTLPEIEKGLEQLAGMGCLFATFTGGEIFCRKDLIPILESAGKLGFALNLFTNGTLMTPRLADMLAKIEPLSVEISLYSMDPTIHDRITGRKGSHRRTLSAIRMCRARDMNTVIKCILLKYNAGEYAKLRDFAVKAGARFVFDYALAPADNGSRLMPRHGLSETEIFDFIMANAGADVRLPDRPDMNSPLCGAGSNALCINPAGDVFPCLAVRQSVGNIRKEPLGSIWSSLLLDKMRNSRYCNLVECRQCDSLPYCLRCSGVALSECGNVLGKSDSACAVARATRRAVETLVHSRQNKQKKTGR